MKTIMKIMMILAIVGLSSCAKRNQNKLVGTWVEVDNYNHQIQSPQTWTFQDDGKDKINGTYGTYTTTGNSLIISGGDEWDLNFKLVGRMKVHPKGNNKLWYIFKKE